MAINVSAQEMDSLAKKLEQFSGGLSENERTVFQSMLARDSVSDQALEQATGGASFLQARSFESVAPQLNASFFRVLSW